MSHQNRGTKGTLLSNLETIVDRARVQGYIFQHKDSFALGYLAAKYGLDRFFGIEKELEEACDKYDETDDLMLMDTIKETLIDLGFMKDK